MTHPIVTLKKISSKTGYHVDSNDFAGYLDSIDELRNVRNEFHYPKMRYLHDVEKSLVDENDDSIYLCGMSLGLCPKQTKDYVDAEMTKWQNCAIEGHHYGEKPWEIISLFLMDKTAMLTGAKHVEVVCMNSLSVNLHMMMVPFYRPTKTRHKIFFEAKPFPSDYVIIKSQILAHGYDPKSSMIQAIPRPGEYLLHLDDILAIIEKEGDFIALVMFSGVHFRTGQLFDMEAITEAAHRKGCKVGFDLAHAIGNVELKLHDWNVDFACWCSYKYLNSGPGGLAGAFLHERYANDVSLKSYKGWWGVQLQERFTMDNERLPTIPGARGFALSNPNVLAAVSLQSGLDIFHKIGMEKILKKQRLLTGYLEYMIKSNFATKQTNGNGKENNLNESVNSYKPGIEIITPENINERGSQLSLLIDHRCERVFKDLLKRGVLCDFRHPNVIRVSPVPLYNSFMDVYRFIKTLKDVMV